VDEEVPLRLPKSHNSHLSFTSVLMRHGVFLLCKITKDLKDFRKSHFEPAGLYRSGKKGHQYGTRSGTGRLEAYLRNAALRSTCERLLDEGGDVFWTKVVSRTSYPGEL
jgi:hypothetical protein